LAHAEALAVERHRRATDYDDRMDWLTRFTFKREAHWLLWLVVLIPFIAFVLAIVLPRLLR